MAERMSPEAAADVFRAHIPEILKAARGSSEFRVMAEVADDGTWHGAARVTPGTGSLLAHNDQGHALYLGCSPFKSRADVEADIDAWEEQAARAEAERSYYS